MKISDKAKLNLIFWSITIPVIPIMVIMLIITMPLAMIPSCRDRTLDTLESVVQRFALWRNNLPIVKNAYDKVHLFDYLKESS